LEIDLSVRRAFNMKTKMRISQERLDTDEELVSQLQTIERALENRTNFAIRQKKRLKVCIPFIESKNEQERLMNEVNPELQNILDVLDEFYALILAPAH